jgi:thioredoxin 1
MKNAFKSHLLAFLITLSSLSCFSQGGKNVLTVDEFEHQISILDDEQIVDVRTSDEFSKGYIEGAFNVDVNGPEFQKQVSALDKTKPVFVYCLSGGRSAKAAAYMRKQGFTKVFELEGGMLKWNANKKPVVAKKKPALGMTSTTFEETLSGGDLVLVDFYAPWCAPCKKMAPELQSIEKDHSGEMVLVKINADENRMLMDSLKIQAIPQLMLFSKGKIVWSHSGLIEKEKVVKEIAKYL